MTPLVLLFIGLAVNIKRKQVLQIFGLLAMRAGIVFLLSGLFVMFTGFEDQQDILLLLAFGLSACSFWPFAHISSVDGLEKEMVPQKKTFNTNYAISILALSFPLSTLLILGVLNAGTTISSPWAILAVGAVFCGLGMAPSLAYKLRKAIKRNGKLAPEFES